MFPFVRIGDTIELNFNITTPFEQLCQVRLPGCTSTTPFYVAEKGGGRSPYGSPLRCQQWRRAFVLHVFGGLGHGALKPVKMILRPRYQWADHDLCVFFYYCLGCLCCRGSR